MSDPLVVPLKPLVAQVLNVLLGGQFCTLNVYFKAFEVAVSAGISTDPPVYRQIVPCFLDLAADGEPIVNGALCENDNVLVRDAYLGFAGDLAFHDTWGREDPQIAGLGTRWLLLYWADLP